MTRVLLTGATGFVGRACVPALRSRGYEVHAVSRAPAEHPAGEVRWHAADLHDAPAVAGLLERVRPTHLLHLAWVTEPGRYWTSPENFRWVRSGLELFEAFHRRGGRRVVVAGTCAEYDWSRGLCSERSTPLRPATPYGRCKRHLQGLLAAFAAAAGLSAAWGRLFFVYGPHEHPSRLVPSVARSLLRGEPAPCSHGRQLRDFLHVEDAGDAFAALLDGEVEGPVNVASGEPVAVREMVERVAERIGRPGLVRFGELDVAPGDPRLLVADTRRLEHEVGWTPAWDLERGLEQTVEFWRAEHRAGSGGGPPPPGG